MLRNSLHRVVSVSSALHRSEDIFGADFFVQADRTDGENDDCLG